MGRCRMLFSIIKYRRGKIFLWWLPFGVSRLSLWLRYITIRRYLGSNGFNFAFCKRLWSLLHLEVRIMFDQFFNYNCYPEVLAHITLIPKVDSPLHLGEVRPIYLLGSRYKLVAKVLDGRLARNMDIIIIAN